MAMAPKWTERRVEDLERRVDREFARVNDCMHDLRREMRSELNLLRREMIDLRFKRNTTRSCSS
jgi:hypothetical protein